MPDEPRNPREKGGQDRPSEKKHRQGEKGGQQPDDEKSRRDQKEQERNAGQRGRN